MAHFLRHYRRTTGQIGEGVCAPNVYSEETIWMSARLLTIMAVPFSWLSPGVPLGKPWDKFFFYIKYMYFPCMLHCHAAILHALFTNYMLFFSKPYTFNILLSIYCALVIVPYYWVYVFFKVFIVYCASFVKTHWPVFCPHHHCF